MRSLRSLPGAVLAWTIGLAETPAAQTLVDPLLEIQPYSFGELTSPTFFIFLPRAAPTDPVDVLVCENGTGRVKHFRDGFLQGVALDLAISLLNERGLEGIAVHPDFLAQPWVYLYYSSSTTGVDTTDPAEAQDNRVERYLWDGSTLTSGEVVVVLPVTPGPNHNGGVIDFGPDGMLYGSIGDLNRNGQLQNFPSGPPPDDTSILFRLQPDGTPPPDNPFFAMGGAMQKVYAYGMRNSFGLAFDPLTGQLWNTDNGPSDYDEINRVAPGMNGGWEALMGPASRSPGATANLWVAPGSQYVDPQFSWLQSFGVTAITFLEGDGLGEAYRNDAFVAAHNSMAVYHFELTAGRDSLVMPAPGVMDRVADDDAERDLFLFAQDVGVITDMDTGPDGALYLLSFNGSVIYRVARAQTSSRGDVRPATGPRLQVVSRNPFRGSVQMRMTGAHPRFAVELFDAAGRRVRVLRATSAGFTWDGRDDAGVEVGAGVYFARLWGGDMGGRPQPTVRLVRLP